MHDRLCHADALQHSLGELSQLHICVGRHPHARQHLGDAPLAGARLHAGEACVVIEEFGGSEIVVEVRLLGQESDHRLHIRITPIMAQ